MKINKQIILLFLSLLLFNCAMEKHKFPLDKRYWDVNDYSEVVLELRFGYEDDEERPTFSNPQKRIIIEKLTDEQNFKVVLDDDELGIKYRNEIATKFFNHWKDMHQIYQETDRKDKYIYELEMLAVWQFGLDLQLDYFKLGNDEIIESAQDPNSISTKRTINSNIDTLISNFMIYLGELNNEKAFTQKGKLKLANGIDKYFSELINLYPEANYSEMKRKSELIIKKSQSNEILSSLKKLIELIDSKKIK